MKTALYGGAIVCDVPEGFANADQFRTVPDHQEVFVDLSASDRSIIFEIVDYEPEVSNEQAPSYFFNDYSQACGAVEASLSHSGSIKTSGLVTSVCSAAGSISASKLGRGEKDAVTVCMSILRIPSASAEILIIFNWPSGHLDQGLAMLKRITDSFEVVDRTLFA